MLLTKLKLKLANMKKIKDKDIAKFTAYKVFSPNWTCKGYDFKTNNGSAIGSIHEINPKLTLELCHTGFHFCRKPNMCFNYYSFNSNNKVAEIEILGDFIGDPENKECSNKIRIIRELSWEEVLRIVNTGKNNSGRSNSGDWNSGNWNSGRNNSGSRNSGSRNSGNWNSGHNNSGSWNSGEWNSGSWNSCNYENGYFNSLQSDTVRVFNKDCNRNIWGKSNKPKFIYFNLTEWVSFSDMSDEEKMNYPKAYICDGYLKTYSYKEAWQKAYSNATKEDIELLKALPNFDAKVFFEISGINIE